MTVQDAAECSSQEAAEGGRAFAAGCGPGVATVVPFDKLHRTLGATLGQEQAVLLLYNLLRACPAFYAYVLARKCVIGTKSMLPWLDLCMLDSLRVTGKLHSPSK